MPRKMIPFTRTEFLDVRNLLNNAIGLLDRFQPNDKNTAVDRIKEAILKMDDVNRECE